MFRIAGAEQSKLKEQHNKQLREKEAQHKAQVVDLQQVVIIAFYYIKDII